ncbi:MAG: hypothetical protein AAB563_00110 [Patescibacteria group bacterium]
MEGFGVLAPNGEEFVIGRPDTPRPWFNLLTNGQYRLEIAQDGRAIQTLGRDGSPNLTSRYIYIRDLDSDKFWSITWQPVGGRFDKYECHHKIGTTDFKYNYDQIDAFASVSVPDKFDGEVWHLRLQNTGDKKRRLAVYFTIGLPDEVNEAGLERGLLIGRNRLDPAITYFCASDRTIDSFDCSREAFLGQYGSYPAPQAVIEGKCSRSSAADENALITISYHLTLGKNATTNFDVFTGATRDMSFTRQTIALLKQPGAVANSLTRTAELRQQQLGCVTIKTSDSDTNKLFNYFWKFQALNSLDRNQQTHLNRLVTGLSLGQTTTTDIERVLSTQSKNGELDDVSTTSELCRLLITYLKETGDFDLFHRQVEYRDGGNGTVLHHFIRALNYCHDQLSVSGLIKVKVGGDSLESTALTGKVAYCWREAIPILEHFGEHQLIDRYSRLLEKLRNAVDRHLRQGRYYSSGIFSTQGKIGQKNKPRQIDADAQSWLIIGSLMTPERAKGALRSVDQRLSTKYGTVNFSPPYPDIKGDCEESVDLDSPGSGRNSAILASVTARLIWAKTLVGQGDEAERVWKQINPQARATEPNIYRAEPFIVADSVFGPAHQHFGQGSAGWDSPGAGLLWTVMLEQILGVQPVLGGLKIDPCLPKDWRQVEVTRQFRGADYHIRIQNPFRVSKGVDRIIVDGVRLTGNVIRPFARGSHFVEVTLG